MEGDGVRKFVVHAVNLVAARVEVTVSELGAVEAKVSMDSVRVKSGSALVNSTTNDAALVEEICRYGEYAALKGAVELAQKQIEERHASPVPEQSAPPSGALA